MKSSYADGLKNTLACFSAVDMNGSNEGSADIAFPGLAAQV